MYSVRLRHFLEYDSVERDDEAIEMQWNAVSPFVFPTRRGSLALFL